MGLPKSPEHYQQEAGRAGRDGLEASCTLLFSGSDLMIWKSFQDKSDAGANEASDIQLNAIYKYAAGNICRHEALSSYFGESLDNPDCGACDVCLGELPEEDGSLVIAQKIVSAVVRLKERFGADYTAQTLIGSKEKRIMDNGHDELSTYGLLKDHGKPAIRDWMDQLLAQGFLEKYGEYNTLRVPEKGWELLRGNESVSLIKSTRKAPKSTQRELASWEGIDKELYAKLREVRKQIAYEKGLPAFVIFGDASLRDMAKKRPETAEQFLQIHGVGETKLKKYGEAFLEVFVS